MSRSPPFASDTVRPEELSSRVASDAVKPGGMCWTMTVPSPRSGGSAGTRLASAFGPPVEQAMTTARLGPPARRSTGAGRAADTEAFAAGIVVWGRREIAARHILS